MRQRGRSFRSDESGAISPLYAVGILVLVAVAGVGFDYGRLMTLDSELQNAADQAALAAATQLDGGDDAMIRARDAATNAFASAASPYVNQTRIANDGNASGRNLTSLSFTFYDGYDSATDTPGNEITDDSLGAEAQVVEVTVNAREVYYALTPLIGAFSSGDVIGKAMAALQSATCNVPPMMFCVPNGADGSPDSDFPTTADIGKGLKLHFKSNGSASPSNPNQTTTDDTIWAPGNFGFLDIDYLSNKGQNSTTGLNSNGFGCTGEAPTSEPGFRTPQGSALNSRFDLYPPPVKKCNNAGDFCPAQNVRKNLVLKMSGTGGGCTAPNNVNANDWKDPSSVGIQDPGYPKDLCFSGSCSVIGDGDWGADSWLGSHHGVTTGSIPDLNEDGSISRYEVYQWELSDPSARLASQAFTGTDGNKYCSFPQPIDQPPGIAASASQKDRRIMTVAAVDCTGLNGKAPVNILRWVDVFLVQPVDTTANDRNFFTEIVGPASRPNGDSGFQYYGKRKAVLIR